MILQILILINLNLLAYGAHTKDKKDSKEPQKDSQSPTDYNPLGALVR